jgi:hypothetical protein
MHENIGTTPTEIREYIRVPDGEARVEDRVPVEVAAAAAAAEVNKERLGKGKEEEEERKWTGEEEEDRLPVNNDRSEENG